MVNLCKELRRQGKCNDYKCTVACEELIKLKRIKRKLLKLKS